MDFFFLSLYQFGNLIAVMMAMPSESSIEQHVLFGGQKPRAKVGMIEFAHWCFFKVLLCAW